MKKQTKGIIFTVIFGGGLLFWATAASLPGLMPPQEEQEFTVTGTPADNFPDQQRSQFCGIGNARSNDYITEYKIPTECTQPLAIVADPQGTIWFAQTNTGKIAKFDPDTEKFTEFDNEGWPARGRSMMWGMDYSPDGSIWYTDEAHDLLWRFSIIDETYQTITYPRSEADSLPQKLEVVGSQIIVNDFTGNKITFLDPVQSEEEIEYLSLPSPVENSVTGDFVLDSNESIWYTNWVFQQDGVLVKFDQKNYYDSLTDPDDPSLPLFDYIQIFEFPPGLTTPNGITVDDNDDKIWIADTSSSFFFQFDPNDESFTRYLTSDPTVPTYGNSSGLIKTPVSRPYWMDTSDDGRIVFNEQTANRIAFFDPKDESLVEYLVPSKNPFWADCELLPDCGLAQVFGFDIAGDKVWFTEWVENNIGVLDTSVTLPLEIEIVPQEITLSKGESTDLTLQIVPLKRQSSQDVSVVTATTATAFDLTIEPETSNLKLSFDELPTIPVTISANENALSTTHKVLVGLETEDVTISKYITVNIEP